MAFFIRPTPFRKVYFSDRLLGEDLSHFTNGKKIASFVGLTCSEYSSGETGWKGRITGMGSGFIRMTLIESSWVAIRKDPALLAKFSRIWRSSGSKKKAIVGVARMLIVPQGVHGARNAVQDRCGSINTYVSGEDILMRVRNNSVQRPKNCGNPRGPDC